MRTVGSLLKNAREEKDLTLSDVAQTTKIKEKFLMSESVPGILGHECDYDSWKKLFDLISQEVTYEEGNCRGKS